MYELRNMYSVGIAGRVGNGLARASAEEVIASIRAEQEQAQAANGGGGGGYGGGNGQFGVFAEVMLRQVDRRIALLRNAAKIDIATAESGVGAEEIEAELEQDN
jgi:hypothetical protein